MAYALIDTIKPHQKLNWKGFGQEQEAYLNYEQEGIVFVFVFMHSTIQHNAIE